MYYFFYWFNELLVFLRRPNVSLILDIILLILIAGQFVQHLQYRFWLGIIFDILAFGLIAYEVGRNLAKRRNNYDSDVGR